MAENNEEIKRIAIVGPECTGKSVLSQLLAAHYKTNFVPEYAREYIDKLGRTYTLDDIVEISKAQVQTEDEAAKHANKLMFCDTNLIVTKIWAEFKYHQCPQWIKENVESRKYALHLLTVPDIPWESDPQREHPQFRQELFEIYRKELERLKVKYVAISGDFNKRLQLAISAVDALL